MRKTKKGTCIGEKPKTWRTISYSSQVKVGGGPTAELHEQGQHKITDSPTPSLLEGQTKKTRPQARDYGQHLLFASFSLFHFSVLSHGSAPRVGPGEALPWWWTSGPWRTLSLAGANVRDPIQNHPARKEPGQPDHHSTLEGSHRDAKLLLQPSPQR